ncbi:unnamed protein product [Chironomus riparius]|uniref:Uncharacterized protein n=1 Tax=Chironomus riparius TaxID=315576 RepID=A0A9N9RVE8_9DIPT|nr:unnamed protein product [Chironomus riparius]
MDTLIGLLRKTFRVIQFSNEFGPTDNMELVVLPSRSSNQQSTISLTEVGNFQLVENLSSFFKSVEISPLAKESNKVLLFKLKIEEILFKPSVAELDELAELFANNSIVILLSTKDGKNFFLYWKSKEIRNFLMLKIYNECDFMNDLRLFEFLAKFLSNGLMQGHLGLHSALPINSTTNAFELHLLADHRNYNLLLIAAEQGNQFVVNFMLDGGFSTESYDANAQTLAYNNKHFEILLSLLKSNLPYPESIKMNECPNDIIEFYEVTESLNEAMLLGNLSTVLEILSLNPEMLHFYNLSNESAPVFALRNKLWDMYALLISKDIKFGRQENFSEIKDKLKDSEHNSVVYPMLESHLISNMLKQESLNFSSFHMRNLESLVTHNWKNMTSMLREKVLASSLNFQGQILNFEELNKSYPKVLDHLSSDQIIDILDGKIISVHKMMKEESFYVERKFLDENINAIFFEFMEYVKGDELNGCFSSNLTGTSKTFEDFYKEFTNQSIPSQINRFNQIKQDEIFKKCKTSQFWIKSEIKLGKHNYMYKVTDQLSLHTSMHLKFEQILEIANKFKMFILSAVAGSGKSQTFMQFATRIKEKYPMRWITYIDLKDYKNFDLNVTNLQDVQELLERFFNLSSKNDFEKAIFDTLFESGNVILLWNGFDEIAPTYSNAVMTILNIIKNNSKIIQFICTRPLYSDLLGNNLQSKTYTFLPFEKEEQKNFVKQFFISQNFDEKTKNFSGYLEKVEKIVISTSPEVGFDTPLMLLMIAELILNDADIYESENLYEIYRKFAEKKFEIWMENEFAKSFLKTILLSDFNMMKLYQSYAIKNEFLRNDKSKIYLFRLTLMNQKIPENLTNDEISRMGILHINDKRNFKFTHKTFSEFFVVQYLIDNIYNAHDEPSDDEAELRIWLFFESITRPDIKRFINAFYKTKNANESNRFDLQIGKVLKTKFKKLLFYNLEQFDINKFIFLLNFFKKDRNVLKTLLQIDENETFYTALFNFAHVEFLREDRLSIKNILKPYLTDDEFKQLINGRNQKGIILFSVYCLRYKQYVGIDLSHDTYKLDDQLLISTDPFYVFESIAKNLTKAELKELLESKIVSESIQLQDGSKHDIFNDKMWNIIEKCFNKFEQKEILENIFPYFGSQNILKFVLNMTKVYESYFSVKEIQEIILSLPSDYNLNLIAIGSFKRFEMFVLYLKKIFFGNEEVLNKFLMRNIEPMDVNILEMLEDSNVAPNVIESVSNLLNITSKMSSVETSLIEFN